jgi:hypothetical protein
MLFHHSLKSWKQLTELLFQQTSHREIRGTPWGQDVYQFHHTLHWRCTSACKQIDVNKRLCDIRKTKVEHKAKSYREGDWQLRCPRITDRLNILTSTKSLACSSVQYCKVRLQFMTEICLQEETSIDHNFRNLWKITLLLIKQNITISKCSRLKSQISYQVPWSSFIFVTA